MTERERSRAPVSQLVAANGFRPELRTARQIELALQRETLERNREERRLLRQERIERIVLLWVFVAAFVVAVVGGAFGHPLLAGGGGVATVVSGIRSELVRRSRVTPDLTGGS